MGNHTDIAAALNTQALNASVPVVVENTDFTPINNPFIRVTLLPADTENIGIEFDSTEDHTGIYQCDVFVPQGKGNKDVTGIIDELSTLFARGTKLIHNGIAVNIEAISRGTGVRDGGYYITPVFITYRSLI